MERSAASPQLSVTSPQWAPALTIGGRRQSAVGCWLLAVGWRLAAGGWRLAAGGWRLAAGG
ncbi:hypothetical protein CKO17_09395 [Marichromatium gracile]|nr:hypothetical protein [Marichromatium gracile]